MLHVVFDGISVVYLVVDTSDDYHKASRSLSTFLRVESIRDTGGYLINIFEFSR
jgi:hypothetical protein